MPAFDALIQRSKWTKELLKWRQKLEYNEETRVISQNLNREVELNPSLIPKVQQFLDLLGQYLSTHGLKGQPAVLIKEISDGGPTFHLLGGLLEYPPKLSRILALDDVNEYLSEGKGYLSGDLTPIKNDIENGFFEPRGTLKTIRPFAWVTTTSFMENRRSKSKNKKHLAELTIEGLGLLHLDYVELAEIIYPDDHSLPLRRPTVFDAGEACIFRPCKDQGDFGRSIHLKHLHCEGPEAVHIEAGAIDGFQAKLVGYPNSGVKMDWNGLYESNDPIKNRC